MWYLAICVPCSGGFMELAVAEENSKLMAVPFTTQEDRTAWVLAHMGGTGHAVLLINQETD